MLRKALEIERLNGSAALELWFHDLTDIERQQLIDELNDVNDKVFEAAKNITQALIPIMEQMNKAVYEVGLAFLSIQKKYTDFKT